MFRSQQVKTRFQGYVPIITWDTKIKQPTKECTVKRGMFLSPFKDLLPTESQWATFDLVEPVARSSRTPVAIVSEYSKDACHEIVITTSLSARW
jgi:hypothetical protein